MKFLTQAGQIKSVNVFNQLNGQNNGAITRKELEALNTDKGVISQSGKDYLLNHFDSIAGADQKISEQEWTAFKNSSEEFTGNRAGFKLATLNQAVDAAQTQPAPTPADPTPQPAAPPATTPAENPTVDQILSEKFNDNNALGREITQITDNSTNALVRMFGQQLVSSEPESPEAQALIPRIELFMRLSGSPEHDISQVKILSDVRGYNTILGSLNTIKGNLDTNSPQSISLNARISLINDLKTKKIQEYSQLLAPAPEPEAFSLFNFNFDGSLFGFTSFNGDILTMLSQRLGQLFG